MAFLEPLTMELAKTKESGKGNIATLQEAGLLTNSHGPRQKKKKKKKKKTTCFKLGDEKIPPMARLKIFVILKGDYGQRLSESTVVGS